MYGNESTSAAKPQFEMGKLDLACRPAMISKSLGFMKQAAKQKEWAALTQCRQGGRGSILPLHREDAVCESWSEPETVVADMTRNRMGWSDCSIEA
jgi:hypothetical protein